MTWNTKALVGLMAAFGLMAPTTLAAQPGPGEVQPDDVDDAVDEDLDDADEDDRPWSLGGGLRMMVGQGTFVSPSNDTEFAGEVHDGSGAFNRVSLFFGINAGYRWNDFSFSGSAGFSQYLSAGGGSTRPYEGRFQDIQLSAEHEGFEIGETDINVSPSLSADLPLSTASRTQTMLTSFSGGVSISKTFFDAFSLGYSLSGSRNFHRSTTPILQQDDIQDDDLSSPLYRVDGSEDLGGGRFTVGRLNTQWGLSNSLSASIMFSPSIQVMANYGITNVWSYGSWDDDEFSSEIQCTGRCSSQIAMGMVSANYVINENMSASLTLNNTQPPKTADQKSFNFPFWNFTGAASNSSRITLGLMGRY